MESFHFKWKQLHQSSKDRLQSPLAIAHRFRSNSKGPCLNATLKSNSIADLLSPPTAKPKSIKPPQSIEFYETKGKENIQKMGEYLKDPNVLKKELARISDDRPQDKVAIDSAITLINNYEQQIKALKEQVAKQPKIYVKKISQIDQVQLNRQKSNKDSSLKDLLASEKTVQSIPSGKRVTDAMNVCASDYYFPSSPDK